MAKYQIISRPTGLRIEVSDTAGKQDALLNALQECKEGRCSCRAVLGWPLQVATITVPAWPSVIAFLVTASLAIWGFRSAISAS